MSSARDDSDITTRYKRKEAQDLDLLKKYQAQLENMSHPACAGNKFTTYSVCFRNMIADFRISSMAAFDLLNILATKAILLDRDKHVPNTLTKQENDAHLIVLELNFLENQIFVLEKVNHDDLLVHTIKTKTEAEVEVMASHRLREKQRYEAFWRNAHNQIKTKFEKIYKLINNLRKPAQKSNNASKTIVTKYESLLARYKKVYDGAINRVFPQVKFK